MKQSRSLTPAVAYMRTSSAANVGADKDSEHRQREAIQAFARRPATRSWRSSTTRP